MKFVRHWHEDKIQAAFLLGLRDFHVTMTLSKLAALHAGKLPSLNLPLEGAKIKIFKFYKW